MIVRLQDGRVEGPLSNEEWAARVAVDSNLRSIKVRPVAEAWRLP